ncbi:MAG: polar amino acid transport system substrate-binding protein [Alphaproteobacteria bacterium]|nr:polar amino acid transport system substrate-binding protein [Alphaproteobacteria bacterium]
MDRLCKALCAAILLAAGTVEASAQGAISPEALKELAPTGKLRAAINLGNAVLAQKDAAGLPKGITPDLSRELGRRIGVAVELVAFDAAGKTFEALKAGAVDLVFIAIEPVRAAEIEFTAPYVNIEGGYMVTKDSPLKGIADVDRPGIKIAVGLASAYDLYLTRTIKNAQVVRAHAGGGEAMVELFLKEKLDVVAGVKPVLVEYAKTNAAMRVMDGRFMVIEQAMGVPKGRTAAAKYLRGFVEDVKASGFVADALKRSNQADATVAPPAGT